MVLAAGVLERRYLLHLEDLEDLPLAQARVVNPVLSAQGDPARQQQVHDFDCPQRMHLVVYHPAKVDLFLGLMRLDHRVFLLACFLGKFVVLQSLFGFKRQKSTEDHQECVLHKRYEQQ